MTIQEDLAREVSILRIFHEQHVEREKELTHKINELEREITDIRGLLTRWHGVFIAVVGVGAFVGWLLTQLQHFIGPRR